METAKLRQVELSRCFLLDKQSFLAVALETSRVRPTVVAAVGGGPKLFAERKKDRTHKKGSGPLLLTQAADTSSLFL